MAFLFVLPAFLLFIAFRFGPSIAGVALSFFDYDITGEISWRGLDHFQRMIADPLFWRAMGTTLIYTVFAVPIALVLDGQGEVHAIGDTCTHGDISLSDGFVEGDTLECWAHGSMFSLKTGKPLTLPAYEPVPVYAVSVDADGVITIDPNETVAV